MLQKFSKGEDKAFFRQNDTLFDQICFFREIDEEVDDFHKNYFSS